MESLYPRKCKHCNEWFISKTEYFEHFQLSSCNAKRRRIKTRHISDEYSEYCDSPVDFDGGTAVDKDPILSSETLLPTHQLVSKSSHDSVGDVSANDCLKPKIHWAKELNVVVSNLVLKMKKRNFTDTDVSMVLQENEKILKMALANFIGNNEMDVAMELAFTNVETKHYRDQLIKVIF